MIFILAIFVGLTGLKAPTTLPYPIPRPEEEDSKWVTDF